VTRQCLGGNGAAHHNLEGKPSDRKEARKWKHLILKFGNGVELSAKSINEDAGEDEKVKLELIPVTITHPKLKTACTTMYAAWKVACIDLKANKRASLRRKMIRVMPHSFWICSVTK
jgi:hypothetical protein